MKRLAVITTSLFLALAVTGGAAAAYAEEAGETVYPEDFNKTLVFDNLKDYEINGNVYFFQNGETYYRYDKHENGESGELTEFKPDEEFSFSEAKTDVTTDKYYYYFDDNGALTVYEKSSKIPHTFNGEYSNLKEFGGSAYAVKENVLYRFENADEPSAINPVFVDYTETEKIVIGSSGAKLTNYEALTFVIIKAGAFITAIDLTEIEGREHFKLDYTKQKALDAANGVDTSKKTYSAPDATFTVENDTYALLLCYSGNAAIVALGDTEDGTAYILLNSQSAIEVLGETAVETCKQEPEFANATIVGNRIYASPFTVIGTTLKPNAAGTNVKVISKIVCNNEYANVLNSVYYEVVYANENGEEVTGYVAAGFLTENIIEDNKDPAVVPDPEHNESTRVTTVLLVLAVVILVLIAVGYIVYTATSGKKRKDKKEKPEPEQKTE